jgi:hypothetical protein
MNLLANLALQCLTVSAQANVTIQMNDGTIQHGSIVMPCVMELPRPVMPPDQPPFNDAMKDLRMRNMKKMDRG